MAKRCISIDDQVFACGDEHQMERDARELRKLRDAGDPQFAGKRIAVVPLMTTPHRLRGDRGRRNVQAKGIRGIDTGRVARTGLLTVLSALAGGAAAYGVWRFAQSDLERRLGGDAQSLRRELERGGANIEQTAQRAAREAAERQVWATLGSFGLSQDRIRAIQQVVQRAESTLGLRGVQVPAAPPAPAPKKPNGGGNGFPEGGDGGDDGGAGYLN